MSKPKLDISFKNFWTDFDVNDNIFTHVLKRKYDLYIVDNSDIVFTSNRDTRVQGKKILFTGEPGNEIGNCNRYLSQYDITGDDRCHRFPLYLYYSYEFMKDKAIDDLSFYFKQRSFTTDDLARKHGFCTFICGGPLNGNGQFRDDIVRGIMKYKKVDCPGTRFNNMPKLPGDSSSGLFASRVKRQFISGYKFTVGFENNSTRDGYDGYTTEKLVEPMVSNSIPLYWGNVNINGEFNNNAFVNYHDFGAIDKMVERLVEIDNNDELYMYMMNQPWSLDNKFLDEDYLLHVLEKVIFA